jgi:pilus assembly protein CpaD
MSSNRTRLLVLALLAGASLLTGCGTPAREREDMAVGVTPTEQYPLETIAAPDDILLAQHDWGLSEAQADALRDVADRWRKSGDGPVTIEAPASREGSATAYAARDALTAFGVPREAIDVVGTRAPPTAPVRVAYMGLKAHVRECGRNWPDLTHSGSNQPNSNFGCAVNSNLAAMIDNPADILGPQPEDPIDATRRQTVIDKYRRGEKTSSESDDKADGAVSRAIN